METTVRSDSSVRFECFELNLQTRELFRKGVRLKVRGHPIDVLAILVEHPGELVTREMLRKRLWPENTFVDSEQILNNSVGKLREALGDRAETPKYIETLPRLGYRFIAHLESPGTTTAPLEEPRSMMPLPSISKRRIMWLGTATVVASFAVLAFWYAHLPLPAPRISLYQQLTLDGREKIARGTDGIRVFVDVVGPKPNTGQVAISGGKVTQIDIDLPPGPAPWICSDVSPDGTNLLIMNTYSPEDGFMVWLVGITGHPSRYLMKAFAAAWSPDGATVAYVNRHGDIYTIGINGGEPRLLYRESAPLSQQVRTRDLTWSPDGSKIRISRWGGRIYELSSNGTNFHEWLPGWNRSMQKCCGRWTPNGQFFLFLAGSTLAKGPTYRPLAQIWAADERRGNVRPRIAEPTLLASDPLLWGDPIPSRDGRKVFASGVSRRGELDRYDRRSNSLEPYLGGISVEMPDFSRDGRYVAYVSFPEGILWRANRDGSGLIQLTEPPLYPRNPRWSPDGDRILFTDNSESGMDAIYVVSSRGGPPKRLLDGDQPQNLPDWSPDGTRVVYTTFPGFSSIQSLDLSNVETRIVELATGRVTVLPKRPGGFWAPLWSPDGRYIAGNSFNQREVIIFDLKRNEWRALPQNGGVGYHNWSHDGQFIYFNCYTEGKLRVYRVPVRGSREEMILELPELFQGTGRYGYWMSLDPTDAPLILRNVGTDEIYALTLERN